MPNKERKGIDSNIYLWKGKMAMLNDPFKLAPFKNLLVIYASSHVFPSQSQAD